MSNNGNLLLGIKGNERKYVNPTNKIFGEGGCLHLCLKANYTLLTT